MISLKMVLQNDKKHSAMPSNTQWAPQIRHHPFGKGIKYKILYMNQLNKFFRTCLGTWLNFIWELGLISFGNLA